LRGAGIFASLKSPEEAVPEAVVSDFCEEMRSLLATQLALLGT